MYHIHLFHMKFFFYGSSKLESWRYLIAHKSACNMIKFDIYPYFFLGFSWKPSDMPHISLDEKQKINTCGVFLEYLLKNLKFQTICFKTAVRGQRFNRYGCLLSYMQHRYTTWPWYRWFFIQTIYPKNVIHKASWYHENIFFFHSRNILVNVQITRVHGKTTYPRNNLCCLVLVYTNIWFHQ